MWARLWTTGATWLHPDADWAAVALACYMRDCIDLARARYHATTLPVDGRAVVGFSKALSSSLSSLGFDPAARGRLGVTEVRRVSELDRLIQRSAQKRADS